MFYATTDARLRPLIVTLDKTVYNWYVWITALSTFGGLLAFRGMEASAQQRYDSAGVTVVVSHDPPTWRFLSAEPQTSIGVASGGSAYLLYSVSNARLLDDGRIVVANCLPPLLRWYDTAGVYLMGAGTEGEGPEELPKGACARLFKISALTGGRVETWEHAHRRLRVFDSSGAQVSSFVLAGQSLSRGAEFLGRFDRGYLMGEYPDRPYLEYRSGLDSWRDTLVLHSFGPVGNYEHIIDRIAGYPFTRTVLPTSLGEMSAAVLIPFAPSGLAVPWRSSVALGDGSSPEIRVVDRRGRPTMLIRWTAQRIPVTDAMIDTFVERSVSRAVEAGGAAHERRTRTAVGSYPYPDTARSYSLLAVGQDGLLWVQQFWPPDASSATWLGFDRSGSLVAAWKQPRGTRLLDIDIDEGYALLLVRNDLGVESVALYGLVDASSPK